MDDLKKKENVANLLKKGILLSPDFLEEADAGIKPPDDVIVLNRETSKLLSPEQDRINWQEIDKVRFFTKRVRRPCRISTAYPPHQKPRKASGFYHPIARRLKKSALRILSVTIKSATSLLSRSCKKGPGCRISPQ